MQTIDFAIMLQKRKFPAFNLARLLPTVFRPKTGEKLCILIDLKDPSDVVNFAFLEDPTRRPKKSI